MNARIIQNNRLKQSLNFQVKTRSLEKKRFYVKQFVYALNF